MSSTLSVIYCKGQYVPFDQNAVRKNIILSGNSVLSFINLVVQNKSVPIFTTAVPQPPPVQDSLSAYEQVRVVSTWKLERIYFEEDNIAERWMGLGPTNPASVVGW